MLTKWSQPYTGNGRGVSSVVAQNGIVVTVVVMLIVMLELELYVYGDIKGRKLCKQVPAKYTHYYKKLSKKTTTCCSHS